MNLRTSILLLGLAMSAATGCGTDEENTDPDVGAPEVQPTPRTSVRLANYTRYRALRGLALVHDEDGGFVAQYELDAVGQAFIEEMPGGGAITIAVETELGSRILYTIREIEAGSDVVFGLDEVESPRSIQVDVLLPDDAPPAAVRYRTGIACGSSGINSDLSPSLSIKRECITASASGEVVAFDINGAPVAYLVVSGLQLVDGAVFDLTNEEWRYDFARFEAALTNAPEHGELDGSFTTYRGLDRIERGYFEETMSPAGTTLFSQDLIPGAADRASVDIRFESENSTRALFVRVDEAEVYGPGLEIDLAEQLPPRIDGVQMAADQRSLQLAEKSGSGCSIAGDFDYSHWALYVPIPGGYLQWLFLDRGDVEELVFPDLGPELGTWLTDADFAPENHAAEVSFVAHADRSFEDRMVSIAEGFGRVGGELGSHCVTYTNSNFQAL